MELFIIQQFISKINTSYCSTTTVTTSQINTSNILSNYLFATTTTPFAVTTNQFISSIPASLFVTSAPSIHSSTTKVQSFTPKTTTQPTTTLLRGSISCLILNNTIGISSNGRHPSGVYLANNVQECCHKCELMYPSCIIFIFSSRMQQCFTFEKVVWNSLTFSENSYYSIGKLY